MSDELWFGEGFTSYYDQLFLRRAGLIDDSAYAWRASYMVDEMANDPGIRYHSAVAMSELAPFTDGASYLDPTNFGNTFVSYYSWGAAIALGLDFTLRTQFPGKTLDGYMRAVWLKHGKPERWYTMRDLQTVLGAYAGDTAFAASFFRRYITGRETVDYAPLLAHAGFLVRKAHPAVAWMGRVSLQAGPHGVVIGPTGVGTPAYQAGLDRNDQITALDGRSVTDSPDVAAVLASHHPGDSIVVAFIQRGRERTSTIRLIEDPQLTVVPFEAAGMPLTDEMRAFRASWLGKKGGN